MPTIHRAEKATYLWLNNSYPLITEKYSEQDLQDYRVTFMKSRDVFRIDLSLMRREMLRSLAEEFDYDPLPFVEEGFNLFYELRQDVNFYPDVFPVLQKLKHRFLMGSITNGNANAGLTALKDYYAFWISAADVMSRKPDRILFDTFCDHMKIKSEHCLYVGDDPTYDVVGARNAGMKTVWVNRGEEVWPEEVHRADAEITNLYGLLDLLPSN